MYFLSFVDLGPTGFYINSVLSCLKFLRNSCVVCVVYRKILQKLCAILRHSCKMYTQTCYPRPLHVCLMEFSHLCITFKPHTWHTYTPARWGDQAFRGAVSCSMQMVGCKRRAGHSGCALGPDLLSCRSCQGSPILEGVLSRPILICAMCLKGTWHSLKDKYYHPYEVLF